MGIKRKKATVKKFFQDYIKDGFAHTPSPHKPIKDYEPRLLGNERELNGAKVFSLAGAKYSSNISPIILGRVKQFLVASFENNTAQGMAVAIKAVLTWGLSHSKYGLKVNEHDINQYLKMPSKRPERIVQMSDSEIHSLRVRPLGEGLEHFQNRIMFLILALGHGVRSASEMVSLNVEDFNHKQLELRLHRKGGITQVIPLRKQDGIDISLWLKKRHDYINDFHNKKGITGADENAFFIKLPPGVRGNKFSWRLRNDQPSKIFKMLRPDLQISDKKIVGTLRHTSCTLQQQNAMAMGYHESYASTLNSHDETTERDYYVSILGPEIEVLSRFPDENIELCEQIFTHSLDEYKNDPQKTRHLACAMSALEIMGRLQFREVLKKYREGEMDFENSTKKYINLRKIFSL